MRGDCIQMCPITECKMRQKNGLVHLLETDNPWKIISTSQKTTAKFQSQRGNRALVGNPEKMIKEYSRSAADKHISSKDVRPFPILDTTVNYLLKRILAIELNVNAKEFAKRWSLIYHFVADRLRAIRQDMTVQQLPPKETIILLEKMLPFYIVAPFMFEPDGTPLLQDCKNTFLHQFDQKMHSVELDECFFKWKAIDDEFGFGTNKVRAVYLCKYCYRADSLSQFLNWQNYFKADEDLILAKRLYKLLLSYRLNNFVAFFRIFRVLNVLLWYHFGLFITLIVFENTIVNYITIFFTLKCI